MQTETWLVSNVYRCTNCNEWFHKKCVNVDADTVETEPVVFFVQKTSILEGILEQRD